MGPDGAGFIFWLDEAPIGVYADPCAHVQGPPIGQSTADLAAAVAALPGTDLVSGPSDVTVGGHPAKHVVITFRDDVDCNGDGQLLRRVLPLVCRRSRACALRLRDSARRSGLDHRRRREDRLDRWRDLQGRRPRARPGGPADRSTRSSSSSSSGRATPSTRTGQRSRLSVAAAVACSARMALQHTHDARPRVRAPASDPQEPTRP